MADRETLWSSCITSSSHRSFISFLGGTCIFAVVCFRDISEHQWCVFVRLRCLCVNLLLSLLHLFFFLFFFLLSIIFYIHSTFLFFSLFFFLNFVLFESPLVASASSSSQTRPKVNPNLPTHSRLPSIRSKAPMLKYIQQRLSRCTTLSLFLFRIRET